MSLISSSPGSCCSKSVQDSEEEDVFSDLSKPSESESGTGSDNDSTHPDSDHDSSSRSRNGSDSDSGSSMSIVAERERLKRQRRTAKARQAALANKAQRKLAQQAVLKVPSHPAEDYRPLIKANSRLNDTGTTTTQRFQRLRLLVSYLKTWAVTLANFLTGQSEDGRKPDVSHILVTSIIDDTNMKLASQVPGAPEQKKSRTVTAMNHVTSSKFT